MIFIPWWELPGDGLHPLERIKLGQQALQRVGLPTKVGRRCAYDVCTCEPGEVCIHCHGKSQ